MEQLGSYAADLRNLEGASPVKTTQLVLSKFHVEQKHFFEEAEKEIVEQTRRLNDNRVNYQGLSNNLQKSEFNAKSVELVIVPGKPMPEHKPCSKKTSEFWRQRRRR